MVGDAAERHVFEYEKQRLRKSLRPELADRVRWLADEGIQPGYDILSFNEDGTERWIEVKGAKGTEVDCVQLTEGERRVLETAEKGRCWIYIITRVFTRPELTMICDPARTLTWGRQNPRPLAWALNLQ